MLEKLTEDVSELETISKLTDAGFEGGDVSLEISLFEYGLAWQEGKDGILFIYAIDNNDSGEHSRFDRAVVYNDIDIEQEYDWVDWKDIYSFVGYNKYEWLQQPLTRKIGDLLSYYGHEKVLGSSYWEGFKIAQE